MVSLTVSSAFGESSLGGSSSKSVYDFLVKQRFDEKNTIFCSITDGGVEKNINKDMLTVFNLTKKANEAPKSLEPPVYTTYLIKGSSHQSHYIVISIAKTGDGYAQHVNMMGMKKKIYFKSIELYDFFKKSFNESQITIYAANGYPAKGKLV